MDELYPVTVVLDRYSGTYSHGYWIAWNLEPDEVPPDSQGDDMSCMDFWQSNKLPVGRGQTSTDAISDLMENLKRM